MPVYDYKCNTCGTVFEYKQSMSEKSLTTCPPELCQGKDKGKGDVHRMIGKNIGIVFKGTGFYQTDYVKKSGESTQELKAEPAKPVSDSSCSHNGCGCGTNKTSVA